jgi:hypothetical protein
MLAARKSWRIVVILDGGCETESSGVFRFGKIAPNGHRPLSVWAELGRRAEDCTGGDSEFESLTAIPSASGPGPGAPGCAADLAAIAEAIGLAGVSIDDLVFIMTPSLATKARIFAGPHFDDKIFSSSYLPDGTVIGLIPGGVASGYQGQVDVETSLAAVVHLEDATPQAIGTPGSPNVVAAPTASAWQAYLIVVKVRARMAWAVQPACVATVTGAAW